MPPQPLSPINEEGSWTQPLREDEKNPSSSSCNGSVETSSSGIIDDPDFNFDPEAVDFEPLLVSGTGKILSYHSADHIHYYHSSEYYEEDNGDESSAATEATSSSVETNVVSNKDRKRSKRKSKRLNNITTFFPISIRVIGTLALSAFMSMRMLSSRPEILPRNGSGYQMETTVEKAAPTDVAEPSAAAVVSKATSEVEVTGSSYEANQPLFDAVKSNNFELTRMLLEGVSESAKETNNNYDINCEDPNGMTPLIEATLVGNTDLVKLLLSHGARAQPLPGFLHTPLRAACLTANVELIRLLLDEGADPNAQSEGGRTPLMGACFLRPQFDALPNRGELSVAAVELMLSDPRTSVETRNSFGESALDLCRTRDYVRSTNFLRREVHKRRDMSKIKVE